MRRIAILILLFCFGTALYAQEHITFKNIPIEGNASSFVDKLKAQGFVVDEVEEELITMTGAFVGYDDCTLIICITKKTRTVWKVVVWLPKQHSWSSVVSRYDSFMEKYQQKYGKPSKSFEFFKYPYERGDGYELQAISLEKAYYRCYWLLDAGSVSLAIEATDNYTGWVKMSYEDKAGGDLMTAEKDAMIEADI